MIIWNSLQLIVYKKPMIQYKHIGIYTDTQVMLVS